jgi:hypothetical protein
MTAVALTLSPAVIDSTAGDTRSLTPTRGSTERIMLPDRPSLEAKTLTERMVGPKYAIAVNRPDADTVAIVVSLDDQVTDRPVSVPPEASRSVAVN